MRTRRLAVLVLLVAAAGCGGGAEPADQPGEPAVYDGIAASTDCVELQASFDRAEATSERDGGTDEATWGEIGVAYMKAADDRMREVGCYDK